MNLDGMEAIDYIEQNNIQGCIVECGVHEGYKEKEFIIRLNQLSSQPRHIFMYDTFKGMVPPSEHDFTHNDTVLYNSTREETFLCWKNYEEQDHNAWCYCSLENVQKNLNCLGYPQEFLHYIVGRVEDSLNNIDFIPKEPIAILRLDTDWYESSKIELETLYPLVVPRGLIIIDDYYHWAGQRKAVDEYLALHNIPNTIQRINAKVGVFTKP